MGMSAANISSHMPRISNDPHAQQDTPIRFSGEWETKRLDELGYFSKGCGIKRDDVSDEGFPCIRYGELYTRYKDYILNPVTRIPATVARAALQIKTGDLLFAGSGETAEEIGRCAAYIGEEQAYAGGDIVVLTPSNVSSVYIGYLMNHPTVAIQKMRVAQGDAVVHISASNLAQVQISLPSIEEQRAIAEALLDVDRLIRSLETLIAKKRAIKQAAMQQLLTGKTRLPSFSGKWEYRKLSDIGVFGSGNGFPLAFQGHRSGDYPFFKVSDMNNKGNGLLLKNANHWINEDFRRTLGATKFPVGSIIFAKIGAAIFLERKRLLSQESCLDNNMMAFILTASGTCERFFYYLFLRIELGKLVTTTALPSLSSREIGTISVQLPRLDEQNAIATVLSDMDAEIAAMERRRDKTNAVKQGMMQELLSGRVRLVKPEMAAEQTTGP